MSWLRNGFPIEWAARVRQDVAYASRGLRRSPGFTLTVALVLALGLGANAALFSLLDRVFLRVPAGVDAPREIRRLYYFRTSPDVRAVAPASSMYEPAMYPEYTAIRDAVGGDAQAAAYVRPDSVDARIGNATVPTLVSYVTRSYFPVLRIQPALGRFFTADEDHVDIASPVAVISDALRRRAFAGEPAVLGKQISIGGRAYTIIGVTPSGFSGLDLDRAEVWLPLGSLQAPPFLSRPWYKGGFGVFRVIARLPADVAERRLSAMATVAYRRARDSAGLRDTTSLVITGPIVRALGPADRQHEVSISLGLAGVSLMLLLIACGNVANLLLVRATGRGREIAIRRALGISRARLCWQLLTESLLLSALGAAAASLIATWGSSVLRALLMPDTHWAEAAVTGRLIAFIAISSVFTGVLAGLAPAWQATKVDLSDALKADTATGRRPRSWTRTSLLIGQAALSVVLLVGAGLFVRSLRNVRAIDLGFDTRGLVAVHARFRDPRRKPEVGLALENVATQLAALPGVERVAMASAAPLQGAYSLPLFVPGRGSMPTVGGARPFAIPVSPEYFATLGVRLVAGRLFGPTDRAGMPPTAIVSRTMARLVWPGESPLGKCIKTIQLTAPCATVVGVVEDTHMLGIVEQHRFMELYLPLAQSAELEADRFAPWNRVLLVRTRSGADHAVMEFARQATLQRLPRIDVLRVENMAQVLDPELRPWRLGATLFSIMGLLAAIVAAVGMYGVIAYAVSQRTHEMGVRIALGARIGDILSLVVGEGLRVVVVGVAIGIGLAVSFGRLVASLLYGVSTQDPLVLAGACALLALMGLLASVIPALRASRVDPSRVLRAE